MSIVTRTGDDGTTALMYNRRVPKCDPRVEACGAVDALNAALGMARASARREFIQSALLPIQTNLITLMGELATEAEHLERYVKDGFALVTPEMTAELERLIGEIEAEKIPINGWATPGKSVESAALDLARTAARTAERRVCAAREAGRQVNPEILVYLNRLSDLLWLLARWSEWKDDSR